MPVTAYHTGLPGGAPGTLGGFAEVRIVTLDVPNGIYVIHGRMGVFNLDVDEQNVHVGIRLRSTLGYIDRIEELMPARGGSVFPFQTVIVLPETELIDLVASTYNGMWDKASLIALRVDNQIYQDPI